MIYHYTNINALSLILKMKTIRFSRLDTVDDIREAQHHAGINFGQYFFVSCWTNQSIESIPQWNMYSQNMQGVRLELIDYPFNEIELIAPKAWTGVTIRDNPKGPIPFNKLFGESYFIVPNFTDKTNFAGPVNYVSDVASVYQRSIQREVGHDSKEVNLKIACLYSLPYTKSNDWEFQKEYRFSLFALPSRKLSVSDPADGEYFGQFSKLISNSFINNLDTGVKYIDIPISEGALNSATVRMGPLATAGEIAKVEAILTSYAPSAKIETSALTGSIRKR